MVIAGNKAEATMLTTGEKTRMTLSHGVFGETDPEIVKMTGESVYTVEARYPVRERERVLHGVVTKDGFSLVFHTFVGLWELDWVTEEEAERLANEGDLILAPSSSYPLEPERQGKLLWITGLPLSKIHQICPPKIIPGPPGLGKSTTAQLLSREHGYVYYEGDCFWALRNPYVPVDAKEATLAQLSQTKLIGEGLEERREIAAGVTRYFFTETKIDPKTDFTVTREYMAKIAGQPFDDEMIEKGFAAMCSDIARERRRMGGDWVIASVLDNKKIRKFVRYFH